ncbi:MAG: hypothetical protein R2747_17615 [Pyrinomonadaceae bacterium]
MSDKIQKKVPDTLKENTHYALAFGLIATMLFVAGFPVFVIFFFGLFAYFLWKTFSQPSRNETREIFEFYLAANEILRDDERRWFGFEVQEVVARGERILQTMNGAPPLVYFTLGALYNKIGDHKSAVNHLSYVVENENADEATYVYPSPDLRNYVKWLRKIEREPAEAPQTSAAVRALERARRNRGKTLLEESRVELDKINRKKRELLKEQMNHPFELHESADGEKPRAETGQTQTPEEYSSENYNRNGKSLFAADQTGETSSSSRTRGKTRSRRTRKESSDDDPFGDRKPISEVLHDIYDKNIQ